MNSLAILISLFLVTACSTRGAVTMQSGKSPLHLLQYTAVDVLPAGKRKISENARTFHSNYFIPKGSPKFWTPLKNKKKRYRYYATITILGDRRPYTLEFVVIKEQGSKTSSGIVYREVGRSTQAAKALSKYYQFKLEKGLKDRNFVDDFRVF